MDSHFGFVLLLISSGGNAAQLDRRKHTSQRFVLTPATVHNIVAEATKIQEIPVQFTCFAVNINRQKGNNL